MEFHPLKDLALVPPDPARHWLLEGVLPAGSIADVRGSPRSGKTLFCAGLAAAVATGATVFDKMRPERVGPVIYATRDPYGANKLLRAILAGADQQIPPDLALAVVPIVDNEPGSSANELVRTLVDETLNRSTRPVLVIDDNAIMCHARDIAVGKVNEKAAALHDLQRLIRVGINVVVAHQGHEPLVTLPHPVGVQLSNEFDSANRVLSIIRHTKREDGHHVHYAIRAKIVTTATKLSFQHQPPEIR